MPLHKKSKQMLDDFAVEEMALDYKSRLIYEGANLIRSPLMRHLWLDGILVALVQLVRETLFLKAHACPSACAAWHS